MSMKNGSSLDASRREAKECVLVRANCHAEIEAGVKVSPPPGARYLRPALEAGSRTAAILCVGKEMAIDGTKETREACDKVLGGMSADKRAAWIGFLQTHAAITKALDADLIANVGIPLSAFEVLFGIANSDEGYLRMSAVAEQAMLSPSRVSRLVTELERRGLLERRSCPNDSRVVYAEITDEGRTLLAEMQALHSEGIERRFFSALSEEQISQLGELWPRVLRASAAVGTGS